MSRIRTVDAGISRHIGSYSDALRIPAGHDLIVLSGTPGLDPADGAIPGDFAEEARQAWRNVRSALQLAGADLEHIVQVRTWLTRAEDVAAYVAVRREFVSHKPAYMLAVVPQVLWPNMRLELEVVAAVQPATP